MKKINFLAFAFFTASLWIPQNATAQAYPAPAGDIFRQEGIASWYGTEFDGRPTASGEIFNSSQLTAAHPTLPFGTYLLVTNRHNNRQVAVRINDRGPFAASRIIDVSRAAAEQLDMLTTGTAPVLIEAIQISRPPEPPAYQHAQQPAYSPIPAQPQSVYTPVPAQPQSVYTPVPAQPQSVYTPVPAQPQSVYTPVPAQPQSVYTPVPAQQPHVSLAPAPLETPSQGGPGVPITVTIYPPAPGAPAATSVAASPESLPTSGARLIPALTPSPNKTYRLQVGSYKIARNAVDSYVKLRNAGLNAEYERHGELFRVVLKGVRGTDVQSVAEKLGVAGFQEAVIKEE